MKAKYWLAIGAALGGLAVSFGAFGAHLLEETLAADSKAKEWFETAARYHMYHALAVVAVGLLALRTTGVAINVAGASFLVGTLIFSGLLYAMALGGPRILGAIVPIGGSLLIVGWAALAVAAATMTVGE